LNITRSKEGEPKKFFYVYVVSFIKNIENLVFLTPWMTINRGYYNKWYPASQLIDTKYEVFQESDDLKEE